MGYPHSHTTPHKNPCRMMTMLCCFFRSLWERDSPLSGKITSSKKILPTHLKVPLQSQDPSSYLALCKFSSTRSVRFFLVLKDAFELTYRKENMWLSKRFFQTGTNFLKRLLKKKTWRNVDPNNFRNGKRVNAPYRRSNHPTSKDDRNVTQSI